MKLGKKILIMILAIVATTIVAGVIYVTSAFNYGTSALSKTFKDYGNGASSKVIQQTQPISILLMGIDTGDSQRTETWEGNSDTMILMTVNPKTKKTTMTSLERDTMVNITTDDAGTYQAKLNAAYATGGETLAQSTIENLLNIKVDFYVLINMKGLVDLVNAVGGITVTNDFSFPISIAENEPEYTATVEPGTHHINGEQALVYARMRYDDPDGDYGRQKRQREVISKVMKKILSMDSVSNYQKVLDAVSNNMQTNIDVANNWSNLLGYRDALKSIKSYQLKGEDAMVDGVSYQLVTNDNLLKIQNRIKKQLGQAESETLNNDNSVITYEDYYGTGTYYNGYDSATTGYADTSTYGYDTGTADTTNGAYTAY